ncbi:hypothetical protein EVAR_26748_1 [Eumeta japonica]|uniref:Uncharacterized protein n=1 Tax=Eumeta variegata TaxID=151549 RepID=A0A4C2A8N0_EUMVA|nr:hypothetical protein EVAR_26748_1 [Eumeta japonica]
MPPAETPGTGGGNGKPGCDDESRSMPMTAQVEHFIHQSRAAEHAAPYLLARGIHRSFGAIGSINQEPFGNKISPIRRRLQLSSKILMKPPHQRHLEANNRRHPSQADHTSSGSVERKSTLRNKQYKKFHETASIALVLVTLENRGNKEYLEKVYTNECGLLGISVEVPYEKAILAMLPLSVIWPWGFKLSCSTKMRQMF